MSRAEVDSPTLFAWKVKGREVYKVQKVGAPGSAHINYF